VPLFPSWTRGSGSLALPAVFWRFWGEPESRGRSPTKDPSVRRSQCHLASSDLPTMSGVEELLAGPLPLSEGLGTVEETLGGTLAGWEPRPDAPGIWIPWWGSRPPVWRTATPLSSRVGRRARTADRNPGLSQSGEIPWGSIKDSGIKASPVTPSPKFPTPPKSDRSQAHGGSYQCRWGR
jgi:hypothetical protein